MNNQFITNEESMFTKILNTLKSNIYCQGLLLLVTGVLVFLLYKNYCSKVLIPTSESFGSYNGSYTGTHKKSSQEHFYDSAPAPVQAEQDSEEIANQYPKDCFPKDQLTPAELLPSDSNSRFAQINPAGQGELGDQNFLEAGYHTGVNTVGQTLRNANYQIRSEPPNPQQKVSPWLQTTIEPDSNRKPLEIGGNCNIPSSNNSVFN